MTKKKKEKIIRIFAIVAIIGMVASSMAGGVLTLF